MQILSPMPWIYGKLEPFLSLALLMGNPDYQTHFDYECQLDSGYFRTHCILRRKELGVEAGAVAEGWSKLESRIRAAAEAYERLCLWHLSGTLTATLDFNLPYGIGVAYTKKTSESRAMAEYFERKHHLELSRELTLAGSIKTRKIKTYLQDFVWIGAVVLEHGTIGTGYGLTEQLAVDSARRSAFRKKDFPQQMPRFEVPKSDPVLRALTPLQTPWLECWFYGHVKE